MLGGKAKTAMPGGQREKRGEQLFSAVNDKNDLCLGQDIKFHIGRALKNHPVQPPYSCTGGETDPEGRRNFPKVTLLNPRSVVHSQIPQISMSFHDSKVPHLLSSSNLPPLLPNLRVKLQDDGWLEINFSLCHLRKPTHHWSLESLAKPHRNRAWPGGQES